MTTLKSKLCFNCGCEKKTSRGIYCSHVCQQDKAFKKRLNSWLSGSNENSNRVIKRCLTYLYGYKCVVCGISEWMSKPIVLEVEHKDGDSTNGLHGNVCLICPNCHSQTPTYKGANRGKGRHARRKRYAEGKSY